ncbi:MAG TPA: hypothetical protein VMF59_14940 [Bacteroidota bacterium]|nr:hypothetical protein [Bacteroidota bacterium]
MDRWEFCYVDMLRHEFTRFTSKGLEVKKIKRDKSLENDTKDDAVGRFVAELGTDGWEIVSGTADIRPVIFFKKRAEA